MCYPDLLIYRLSSYPTTCLVAKPVHWTGYLRSPFHDGFPLSCSGLFCLSHIAIGTAAPISIVAIKTWESGERGTCLMLPDGRKNLNLTNRLSFFKIIGLIMMKSIFLNHQNKSAVPTELLSKH